MKINNSLTRLMTRHFLNHVADYNAQTMTLGTQVRALYYAGNFPNNFVGLVHITYPMIL